jgi:hypothetical protein
MRKDCELRVKVELNDAGETVINIIGDHHDIDDVLHLLAKRGYVIDYYGKEVSSEFFEEV